MNNRLFKLFYKTHIYVGIFVSLHLLVLTLTGSILLFKDEIEGHESHEEHIAAGALPQIDTFFQNMLQKYPNERPLALSIEEADHDIAQLRLGKDNSKMFRGSRRVYFDTKTGLEVEAPKKTGSFMEAVLILHREFFLGSNGKIYVGLIGLLYAFTLISGFFIYGNFSKKTKFGEIRQQSARTFSGDLHRFLGMTVFAWGLLIAITGLFLGLSSTLIKVYQFSELKKLTAQYPTAPSGPRASLDKVLESAQKALPESSFDYLAFADTQFSPPGHHLVLMHGNTAFTERLVEVVVIDAVTGELTEVRALPWYLKFTMLSEPLHFGNYGGLFLKLVWLTLSLISLALPILGIYIWWDRRRKSKKAAASEKKANILLWTSGLFQRAYLVPTTLMVISALAIVGSFVTHGAMNPVFVSGLLVPVYFSVRVLWTWIRGPRK
ncbi:hypothetical protein AZI86_13115 [Bdellovibrio bacteriovorus]|uniref:PepSY domain-containing protein n=1 Tax=Bdellovibrio bacteriovorus TaxID=959 RepID=A0A150WJ30_BDEBC|nr:PepSY-associated TM helix domain-containing protein [Bdellovibrio bacteriovorus]KYG63759.1 hypothetical protein AZI86_13115 [Bdellovibrio bacteriovorus]